MATLNTDCKLCTNMSGGFSDLALYINGVDAKIFLKDWGISEVHSACNMGHYTATAKYYTPTVTVFRPVYTVPITGGTVRFQLKSLCQYPLYSGLVPPNDFKVGKLRKWGHTGQQGFTDYDGYDITLEIPPYSGGSSMIAFSWCGVFYSDDTQFLKECQTPFVQKDSCEFSVEFRIGYEQCTPCLRQTVETPSTRLNAIVDEQNVYWPLDNGIFTDCIPNSTGTKNAINKIKAKLIEIDNFYSNCVPSPTRTVTAESIPDTNGNCIKFIASGFKTKFRMLHWGGANDPSFFNHSGC